MRPAPARPHSPLSFAVCLCVQMASEGKVEDGSKPSVLILGGMGMVGRNLVSYLVENRLASAIRVADKKMSMLAYLRYRLCAGCLRGECDDVVSPC